MDASRSALSSALEHIDLATCLSMGFAEALKGVGRLEMLKRRELLTPPEVEELYGLKEGTLKVWRCRGGGPAYHQSTKNAPVLYSHDDIQAFLSKSRVRAS